MATKQQTHLTIYAQIEPTPQPNAGFAIVETFKSIDGFRSRLLDRRFGSFEEAADFVKVNTK